MKKDYTPEDELLFLALGGSGEIGMNVNLYGCEGKWLMVDLGMTFGGNEYPGVDLVFADLEFIEDRTKDLLGIVLTHGHEDHIGAVPYFAAELDVPLYATPFTAELVRRKLEEAGLSQSVVLHEIDDLDPFAGDGVSVTGHDQPFERPPIVPFRRLRHRGRGLAGAEDHQPAARRVGRQQERHVGLRLGRSHCRVEHLAQELLSGGHDATLRPQRAPRHDLRYAALSQSRFCRGQAGHAGKIARVAVTPTHAATPVSSPPQSVSTTTWLTDQSRRVA